MVSYMKELISAKKLSIATAYFYQDHLLISALSELGIISYTATGIAFLPPALVQVHDQLVADFK